MVLVFWKALGRLSSIVEEPNGIMGWRDVDLTIRVQAAPDFIEATAMQKVLPTVGSGDRRVLQVMRHQKYDVRVRKFLTRQRPIIPAGNETLSDRLVVIADP